MICTNSISRLLGRAALLLWAAAHATGALAQVAPANDNFGSAKIVGGLPYTDFAIDGTVESIHLATTETTDPVLACNGNGYNQGTNTVWYAYTTGAATEYVNLRTLGSDSPGTQYNTVLAVYTGTPGSLRIVSGGCNDNAESNTLGRSAIYGLRLAPNTTYYFDVANRGSALFGATRLRFYVEAAQRYNVSGLTDGTGSCVADATPNSSTCTTLRAAVSAANSTPGAILLGAGTYTLSLSAGTTEDANVRGDLDLSRGMMLYGTGPGSTIVQGDTDIVTGETADRCFHGDAQTTAANKGRVTIQLADMTVRNCGYQSANGGSNSFFGNGGAFFGDNDGTIGWSYYVFDNVEFRDNNTGLQGGAIKIIGRSLIRNSVFINNSAGSNGGAAQLDAVVSDSRHVIEDSLFIRNFDTSTTSPGGAVAAVNTADLAISNTTFSRNVSRGTAGAIYRSGSGSLVLRSVTAADNCANANRDPSAANPCTTSAVTYPGNVPPSTTTGAIASFTGTGGGLRLESSSSLQNIRNSVFARNLRFTAAAASSADDCARSAGTIVTGYNHVQAPTTCTFGGLGDLTGSDAVLDSALALNGASTTLTYALLAGSPAIDAADPSACRNSVLNSANDFSFALTFDQRGTGFPRVVGAACDKGAFEAAAVLAPGAPDLTAASDSGASNSDDITRFNAPTFSIPCRNGNNVELQARLLPAGSFAPVAAAGTCSGGTLSATVAPALADGDYAFRAVAETSAIGAVLAPVRIVTVAPDSIIATGPTNPTAQTNASFTFNASPAAGASFECDLDGGGFAACTSPMAYSSLATGSHTFSVRALDVAGNVDATPASYSWSILQAQSISFGPLSDAVANDPPFSVAATASSGLTVSFASLTTGVCTVAGATVTLAVDAVGTCTIRASQSGNGSFAAAANVDQSFTVRPPAPATPLLASVDDTGASNSDGVTRNASGLSFSGSCVSGDSIGLVVDGSPSAFVGPCSGGAFSIDATLAEGLHSIRAQATRSAIASANSAATSVTVDLTAPSATVDSGPTDPTSATTASFTFSSNDAQASFECALDAAAFAACSSPRNFTGLIIGGHVFKVRALDIAGNVTATPASYNWVIRANQTISFAAPADRLIGDPAFEVRASASSGLAVTWASATPSICTVTATACAAPAMPTETCATVAMVDVGTCQVTASQGGDSSYAPATPVTRSFAVAAATAATPDLAAASDSGVSATDNVTNAPSLTFSGSCVGDGATITLVVDSAATAATAACTGGSYSITAALAETASAGAAIATRATRGGVDGPLSGVLTVVVDRTAPAAPTLLGPTGSYGTRIALSGTGEAGARISVREGVTITCTATVLGDGSWSCDVVLPDAASHTLSAIQSDAAGNDSGTSAGITVQAAIAVFADGFE